MRRPRTLPPARDDELMARARRHSRRGEHRRAMLLLREVCYRALDDARLWTLYAVACVRAGKRGDAESALRQAVWLRQRDRHADKARVTQALLRQLQAGSDRLRVQPA